MTPTQIDFSIVTPSLNMFSYLKRCHASVIDQQDVTLEHIVMDGGSIDGTAEWLAQNERTISRTQKDNGMYDAINKGLRLAKGSIVAYLNCDEQYLPDTLRFVKARFDQHPELDILFGDALLIRPDGSLIAYRKGYHPRWFYILTSYLYLFSCTMFIRKKVIGDGVLFDAGLKTMGDWDFVIRVLRQGYRAMYVRRYMAAFTMTGKNLSCSQDAFWERKHAMRTAPTWARVLRGPLNVLRLAEKLASGAYFQAMPLEYAVYDSPDADERKVISVSRASFRWPTG